MPISCETAEELLIDQGHRSKIVSAGCLQELSGESGRMKNVSGRVGP